jgi:hypothetical protein
MGVRAEGLRAALGVEIVARKGPQGDLVGGSLLSALSWG